ncbi:hypothetical protein BmR1_04g09380 [Babesia microti strain RI]|uniref:Uncharacterized protein n=1 Tax=Babesia microti (strain RI) TaxID=1133968 RepID=I7IHM0_BABMR|nr:hypothetical protein BmR1_04g09380 [Babesia microti strain RI]CCF76047.1 hypothetical protein BmR1_04g09380 [Babesia microti strain RI]|eukprot:XP_012650455.1 hypothetical protein BmR1_04g09380 [Babesia microti strain RI]
MNLGNSIILDQNPDYIPRRRVPFCPQASGTSFLSIFWSLAKSYYNLSRSELSLSSSVLQTRLINFIVKFTQFISGKIEPFDHIIDASANSLSAIISSDNQGIIILTTVNQNTNKEYIKEYDEHPSFQPTDIDSSYQPILQLTYVKNQDEQEFLTLGYVKETSVQNDIVQHFTLTKQQSSMIAEFTVTFATLNQCMSLGISILVGFCCGRIEHWFQISCSDLRWNGGTWKNSGIVILPYSATKCEFSPLGDIAYAFSKGHDLYLIEITGYELKEMVLENTSNTVSATWCGPRQIFLLTKLGELLLYKQNDLGKWIKTALFDVSSQLGANDYIGAKIKIVRGRVAFLLPPGANKISILSWERGLALPECTMLTLKRTNDEEIVGVSDFDVDSTGTCIGVINMDKSTVLFYAILGQYQNKFICTANNEGKVAENIRFIEYVIGDKVMAAIRWIGDGVGMSQVCSFELPPRTAVWNMDKHVAWRGRQSFKRVDPYGGKMAPENEKAKFGPERKGPLRDNWYPTTRADWRQDTHIPLAKPWYWDY